MEASLNTLMKYVVLVALSASMLVVAQKPAARSPLQEMVAAERAFAKMSEEKGTDPSFLAFIADDGILFRPKAVKGKQWLIDHPRPVSAKRSWLKWEPTFAHMSHAGDMGYTFGPWEYRSHIKDAEAVAFGHFLTVWKKQSDGTWKFAVDLGISHPKPTINPDVTPASRVAQLDINRRPGTSRRVNVNAERAALLKKEQAMSASGSKPGAQVSFFVNNSVQDVRVFREGKLPFVGDMEAMEVLDPRPNVWTWNVEFHDISRSGDLGYSYGTYKLAALGAKPAETGNFLRIWKKEGGVWKIAVDLANPVVDGKN